MTRFPDMNYVDNMDLDDYLKLMGYAKEVELKKHYSSLPNPSLTFEQFKQSLYEDVGAEKSNDSTTKRTKSEQERLNRLAFA